MKHLLICGFGPFPGAPDNPSGLAVRALQARGWTPEGADASYALLPTVWAKADVDARAAAIDAGADALLLVGVASGADAFRVEFQAHNRAALDKPDAEGRLAPAECIDSDGESVRLVGAPTEAMLAAVAALGLPVALSSDAGDYLCNFTLYRVLGAYPASGFLHVPPIGEAFALDDIAAAIRAAAGAMAGEAV